MERKYLILGFIIMSVVLLSGCVQREEASTTSTEPGPIVGDCLIHCSDGTSVLCGQDCPTGAPQLTVYAEADITAQVLQPFIVNNETTKYLQIKVTEEPKYTFAGPATIQKEEIVNAYISGSEDMGCETTGNTKGGVTEVVCKNEDALEKIYANWNVIALEIGDLIHVHVRCTELTENKCSFWEAADSSIILIQWEPA